MKKHLSSLSIKMGQHFFLMITLLYKQLKTVIQQTEHLDTWIIPSIITHFVDLEVQCVGFKGIYWQKLATIVVFCYLK